MCVQAAIHLDGIAESILAVIAELDRSPRGEQWRLLLRFQEPQPALLQHARDLLAKT